MLYARLLGNLGQKLQSDFAPLVAHLRSGNTRAAQPIAHTLRGTAGTLAAVDLQKLAEEIDRQLKEGRSVEEHRIAALEQALDAARQTLAALDRKEDIGAAGEGDADAVQALRRTLEKSELVEDHVLESALLWLRGQGQDCSDLEAQISQLEFEAALATLAAMTVSKAGQNDMNSADAQQTILIVDDEPANVQALGNLLKGDYRIRVATSGEKALAIAQDQGRDTAGSDIAGYSAVGHGWL